MVPDGLHKDLMPDTVQDLTSAKEAPTDDIHVSHDVVDTKGEEHEFPTGVKLLSILLGVIVSFFLLFLDMAIISTATPAITSEFDSLTDIGWYAGAYQLASAAFQPLSGKIYRYFSLKVSRWRPPKKTLGLADFYQVVFHRLLLHL